MSNKIFMIVAAALVSLWLNPSFAGVDTQEKAGGWIQLFDGKTLEGWSASENPDTFKVEDGAIVCNGPRAHLFYMGDGGKAKFTNFVFVADVKTKPGANSGIYFHTGYQDNGWPRKGYEVQINNSYHGEGGYYEYKKTGSLYGIRNLYLSTVNDNEWFTVKISVQGNRARIYVNDTLVVDYIEPVAPVRDPGDVTRMMNSGTFALQGHDPGSTVYFKDIRVKPLGMLDKGEQWAAPVVDDVYAQILDLNAKNFPIVDFHVHLKGGLTLAEALEKSREVGINYGIAVNCGLGFPVTNDFGANAFFEKLKGKPVFAGMQAEGREWTRLFSEEVIERFDYVFTDALTFTDDQGKRVRLWMPEEVEISDEQAFMDMYVRKIVEILENEPIDVFVNPTFLPEQISDEYDHLWTPERMQCVIDAAVANDIAIEINARYRIPSERFISRAKASGAKFTFGTNNGGAELGRLEYCLEIKRECNLSADDMWMPNKPE